MKLFILLLILCSNTFAAECRISVLLQSEIKMETSLSADTVSECRLLAADAEKNKFFGLIGQEDIIGETKFYFRSENGPITEVIGQDQN